MSENKTLSKEYTEIKTASLFDFSQTLAAPLLARHEYPWTVLAEIGDFIRETGRGLGDDYQEIKPEVWVHKTCKIAPTADITAPCIIGAATEVRPGAFIRSKALIGENCVIGNSTELKNVIISNNVQVPHYNYVGDSILGYKSHMGAGSITSNVKADRSLVTVNLPSGEKIPTGCKKFGAMLGNGVEVGCNAVLNPGSIICAGSTVYPLTSVRKVVAPGSICKQDGTTVVKEVR